LRPIPLTSKELAELSGVTERWLIQLASDGHIPKFLYTTEFDAAPHIIALIKYHKDRRKESGSEIEAAKLEVTLETARKLKMENDEKSRQLIPIAWASRLLDAVIVEIKTKILACTSLLDGEKDDLLASIRNLDARGIVTRLSASFVVTSRTSPEADGHTMGGSPPVSEPGVVSPAGEVSEHSGPVSAGADGRGNRRRRVKRVPDVREPDGQDGNPQ